MTSKMSYCNLCLGSKLKAKTKTAVEVFRGQHIWMGSFASSV